MNRNISRHIFSITNYAKKENTIAHIIELHTVLINAIKTKINQNNMLFLSYGNIHAYTILLYSPLG
jgi:hypothetical protein